MDKGYEKKNPHFISSVCREWDWRVISVQVFLDVTLCQRVNSYKCFKRVIMPSSSGSSCLFSYSLILTVKALWSFSLMVPMYPLKKCNIIEDLYLQQLWEPQIYHWSIIIGLYFHINFCCQCLLHLLVVEGALWRVIGLSIVFPLSLSLLGVVLLNVASSFGIDVLKLN